MSAIHLRILVLLLVVAFWASVLVWCLS